MLWRAKRSAITVCSECTARSHRRRNFFSSQHHTRTHSKNFVGCEFIIRLLLCILGLNVFAKTRDALTSRENGFLSMGIFMRHVKMGREVLSNTQTWVFTATNMISSYSIKCVTYCLTVLWQHNSRQRHPISCVAGLLKSIRRNFKHVELHQTQLCSSSIEILGFCFYTFFSLSNC